MLIENTLFGERNKVEIAIQRLKEFEPKEGYILAFSGGKDSCVIYDLAKRAGVKFKAIYSKTSVDPPELVRFIKEKYPDVHIAPYPKDKKTGETLTMWSLIPSKKTPPTRRNRYCCDVLKERTGEKGDTVIVGVRWEESSKRKKLSMVSMYKGKKMVRPIIDWIEEDIWEYCDRYNVDYCELYERGFKRIGCIGCPLNPSTQEKELEMYPKYKEAYLRAFQRMLDNLDNATTWKTPEDVMDWWLMKCKEQPMEGQCSMFDD